MVGACITLLAACENSTGPSGLEGTLSFSYTGGGGGSFTTTGVPPAFPDLSGPGSWAASYQNQIDVFTGVAGTRTQGNTFDAAIIGITRLTAGTESVDTDCDPEQGDCTGFVFIINGQGPDIDSFDFICTLLSGSFTITEVTTTRVRGTFSGSGECLNEALVVSAFTVSSGSFDVPLIPEPGS